MTKDTREAKIILWVNMAIRWGLGMAFLFIGFNSTGTGSWIAISVGSALVITGFYRPKRCLGESCKS